MNFLRRAASAAFLLLAAAPVGALPNPVIFVTQLPIATEVNSHTVSQSFMSVASVFSNHLGDTASAGRGGALWILDAGATVPRNLTLAGGFGGPGQPLIAVRQPHVHWDGTKALFSMVVGSPANAADTTVFYWQIYEITNFGVGQTPVITRLATQPADANNVSPCYGTDGRIIFASDRPHNGAPHLYPQREEYLSLPTNTGLWSLDRNDASSLKLLEHSPSGSFTPFVDSFGRLIFTRWDHLTRDAQGVYDRGPGPGDTFTQTNNGTFNYADETAGAAILNSRYEFFPEPRNFDVSGRAGTNLNGNSFNQFTPWMMNEDGSDIETLNHVGRHELYQRATRSYTNDSNLVDQLITSQRPFINNLFQVVEDPNPARAGTFYAVDSADVGYHGSGPIVRFQGSPSTNPAAMAVAYVTAQSLPPQPPITPLTNPINIYRQVRPLMNNTLLAVYTPARTTDGSPVTGGTEAYLYRMAVLSGSTGSMTPGAPILASPITANVSYFVNGAPFSYNGQMWEFDPVEVVVRTKPGGSTAGSGVAALEAAVFSEENVDLPSFRNFLRQSNLALFVSRNVTTRDKADRQQPFQLKVNSPTSTTQTLAAGVNPVGTIYGISHLQILQADLLRGMTFGTATPVPGRRVLPTPLNDAAALAEMPPAPDAPAPGSVKLGDDGSLAALVPARRAITYHLIDTDGKSQVKERYWISFQPGEVRTCTSCHGLNQSDQANAATPTNKPQALRNFLRFWKANHPPGLLQHANAAVTVPKSVGTVHLTVTRTAGSTGPVSVQWQTVAGTATPGVDYTAATGTLSWSDGDTAAKTISVTALNPAAIGPSKSFAVSLSGATFGATIGGGGSATVTLTEAPYQAWLFSHFGAAANNAAQAGDTADTDGDGLGTLLEYVLGTDPTSNASAALPTVGRTNVGGLDYVTLTFIRDTTVPDATCVVQRSADLQTWQDGSSYSASATVSANAFTVEVSRLPAGPGRETITVRDAQPVAGGESFLRLKATRP
ncbi:MAG: hypothetical protein JSR82_11390 [Verrucomicrobia bacterium]|nr:hypothetical protein [Verrucomicrobiota bacterium]